ncbi:translation release factor eRF1 family protein [Protomyces lactucae-debilis]|uniref:Protein DOM34 homolog n=1 Tax=Protomyces lactucae-debilis TaxID=2754530 RepID=A0A1Y2FA32_PROLT|nr:translation release factor eRF1 family protein [Protomyces lactucae-debilis]ORY80487.1 translation release factor eRF1 family protein [Protomyces lactucae-debilis]
MKLIRKNLEKDGSGGMTLYPEQPEDMWHAYNLIQQGDRLKATTLRRVTTESATGSTTSQKVKTTLTISVTKLDFDTAASELHIAGTVAEENAYVKRGAHHTLDLELFRNFTLEKVEWDSMALERVGLACDPGRAAQVGAVVLQEGLAHICLLTEHMTLMKLRVEMPIPRKARGSSTAHEKGLTRFYETVYEAMKRFFFDAFGQEEGLKAILIASPGFTGEGLLKRCMAKAALEDRRDILKFKSHCILAHCSSGHLFSLAEALKQPGVMQQLADTKFAQESQMLERFYKMMADDDNRAWYGPEHVSKAVAAGAVGTLMLTDTLFRAQDVATRKRHVAMVEQVRDAGGQVLVFSSLHESGKQLGQLGEIAALLTVPLAEEDLDLV